MAKKRRAGRTFSFLEQVESLEDRRLLSGVSWSDVLTYDEPLSVNFVPDTGPISGEYYTIRALVEYYNTVYNGAADESFTIQLQPGTTYTLSNTADASSIDGGRNNGNNEYGALDIQPVETTAPLIIAGSSGTILTCILVGPDSDVPLDRLIHVIGGSLRLQGMTLTGGLALDNGTESASTDALGGGVLVNPDATLSLTNCSIRSNAASGVSPLVGSTGFNAAGGGVYGSAGSTININGATNFTNNRAIAGRGGSSDEGTVGMNGGNAFGAGLAMAADVAEPPPATTSGSTPSTSLSFTAQGARYATFVGNRLNSGVLPSGTTLSLGGTGGTGSQSGGSGGDAYGAGLYLGSGLLNIDGGSLASAILFLGNMARGGAGYVTGTDSAGAGGSAAGGGAMLSPGEIALSNAPTSGGILQFSGNFGTSYTGSTPTTATSGLNLPAVSNTTDQGYTSADGPWNLRTAIFAASALVSTGMDITLNLPALTSGSTYSLVNVSSGNNAGSLVVANSGGILTVAGGGSASTIIDGGSLNTSIFSFNSANVRLLNLMITGANATGNGGAVSMINSDVTITSATLINNVSTGYGGGIYQSGGTLKIGNSKIVSNKASVSGGGLYLLNPVGVDLVNVQVSSNQVTATGSAQGGGLYISGGTLNASGVAVRNNGIVASGDGTLDGGGIFSTGATLSFNGGSSGSVVITGNILKGNGSGSAFGAGIAIANGVIDANTPLSLTNNRITSTTSGAGAGIAFLSGAAFNASFATTTSGNSAVSGGNDYAFLVSSTTDGNAIAPSGPNGIYTFTSGAGSLRSAIAYGENLFSLGLAQSLAIMLTPGTYNLSSTLGPLISDIPAGDSLTIIGQGGVATLNAGGASRVLYVQNSGSLLLQSLAITGGYNSLSGGGIYQESGTLTLADVTVTGNYAGQSGTATNSFPTWTTVNQRILGETAQTGAAGASGYGGGIYLNAGTLNLTGNTTITGNTAQGQNGASGQNGGAGIGDAYVYRSIDSTIAGWLNGQNGGTGGAGGAALGGGLYQAGGTLNLPVGASMIVNNTALPGAGGTGGSGGAGGVYEGETKGSPGTSGASGASGASSPNYSHAGGSEVYSAAASSGTQAAAAGLYMTAASLSSASPMAASLSGSGLTRLPKVSLKLYSADGTLIATATTDSNGRYRFRTDYSGMGYIELVPIPIFDIPSKGAIYDRGVVSGIDPTTRRSGLVQIVSGTVVNRGVDIVLIPVTSNFRNGANSVDLRRSDNQSLLWQATIAPKAYTGRFKVTQFDTNGDQTLDYLLLQKTGAARLSIVDGRTGDVTRVSGVVSPDLRAGMDVRQVNFVAGDSPVLVLSPKAGRSGRISVVDPQSGRVLWTSNQWVRGGMKVGFVGSSVPGRAGKTDIQLSSIKQPGWVKILNGQTGKLVIIRRPMPKAPGSSPTLAKANASASHARVAGARVVLPHRSNMATLHRSAKSALQPRTR